MKTWKEIDFVLIKTMNHENLEGDLFKLIKTMNHENLEGDVPARVFKLSGYSEYNWNEKYTF